MDTQSASLPPVAIVIAVLLVIAVAAAVIWYRRS